MLSASNAREKPRETELTKNAKQRIIKADESADARVKEMSRMCQKAENVLIDRRLHLDSEDREIFTSLQIAEKERVKKAAALERDLKLAKVMGETKVQELAEMKSGQLFLTNSHKVRDDRIPPMAESTQNELICQMKEKEAARKKEVDGAYDDTLALAEVDDAAEKAKIERPKREQNLEHQKAITDQMQEAAEKRRESLRSRRSPVDYEPDVFGRERDECTKTTIGRHTSLESIEKTKKQLKANERKESDELNKRIEEYLTLVDKRTEQQEEMKKKKTEVKNKIYDRVVNSIATLNKSNSHEKSDALVALKVSQHQISADAAAEQKKESRKLQSNEMTERNAMQMKIQKEKTMEIKEKQLAEDHKISQHIRLMVENDEKKNDERRQKMIEYGKELKAAIEENTNLRNKQKELKMNDATYLPFFHY